jgi:UDP-3-O-acyl-N-acetylglucosamine deacetylase
MSIMPAPVQTPSRTLARPCVVEGPCLFRPETVRAEIRPARPGSGLRFRRADLPGAPTIVCDPSHVLTRPRQTVLAVPGCAGLQVETTEHVLSALVGLGVTDALIVLDGPELPMGDGSALGYARAGLEAGIVAGGPGPGGRAVARGEDGHGADSAESRPREVPAPIVVQAPVRVEGPEGSWMTAEPVEAPVLELVYHLEYAGLERQRAQWTHHWSAPDAEAYVHQLAPSRTFCTLEEARAMRRAGHFAHLRPGDVLILDAHSDPQFAASARRRFPDEPARHKVLDMLGDLAVVGRAIHARITGVRSGHALNHLLGLRLLERFG